MINYSRINRNFDEIELSISKYLKCKNKNRITTMRCVSKVSELCKDSFKEMGYRVEPGFLKPKELVEVAKGIKSSEFVSYRNNLFDKLINECSYIREDIASVYKRFPTRNNGALINSYSNSNARVELAIMDFYEKIGYTSSDGRTSEVTKDPR